MNRGLTVRLLRRWQGFVTAGMPVDPSSPIMRRLRFQHSFALITVAALVLFGLFNLISGGPAASRANGVFQLACAALGLLVLVYLRRSWHLERAQSLSLLVTVLVMTFLLFDGGLEGTGYLWWFCLPAGAFFLKGRQRGWWWVGGSFAIFGLAMAAAAFDWWRMPYSAGELRQFTAAYLVVALLNWVYEAVRDDTERRIERTAEALLGANQRLEEEIRGHEHTQTLLEAARQEAENANRAKSVFLSRMSHELRTPMNSILGFAQLMESDHEEPLTPGQRESITHVLRSGRHLLGLINEVLDLARIESGRMVLSTQPVMVSALLADCLSAVRPLADARRIRLRDEISGRRLPLVLVDPARMRQVLLNLLSNAIKYNRDGGEVVLDVAEGAGGRLQVSVTDTGGGIPPDRHSAVFEPFQRLGAEAGPVEGTGIGLTIVKQLVELMAGEIGFDSTPGVGSRFWVEVPVSRESETATIGERGDFDPKFPSLSGRRRVLYIEDDQANLALVRRLLDRRPGIELIHAGTGELGLELAASQSPDLLLLDLHLPGISGVEVLHGFRSDPALARVPVVVVSASALPPDVEAVKGMGIARYLTKPLDIRLFLETIDDVLDLPSVRQVP